MVWTVSRRRALAEATLLAVLAALALRLSGDSLLMIFAFMWISTPCGIWAVFRTKLPAQDASLRTEASFAIGITLLFQIIALSSFGNRLLRELERTDVQVGYLGSVLAFTLLMFLLRLGMILWRRWQQIRQTRLVWAIVHVQVLTVMIIGIVVGIWQGVDAVLSLPETQPASSEFLVSLLTLLIPIIFSVAFVPPMVAVVLLIAGGIAYLIARPITDRVENLAQVTGQVRDGDYGARVAVQGTDEIAQLQGDFNIMADKLEDAIAALKSERDEVQTLLENHREWLTNVSHELRTPVATIRSHLEAPAEGSKLVDVEVLKREALRLQTLLDDLFALARTDAGRLALENVATDVTPIIAEIVRTFEPLAWQKSSVRIISDVAADLPPAILDGSRLEQILSNLLHNSLRHTPPGGIIAIRASAQKATVQIVVEDTGEGIPPDALEHIWERYYSTDDAMQNAGLGLALVRELVMAMNGQVEVYSKVGSGTRFTIHLPRA